MNVWRARQTARNPITVPVGERRYQVAKWLPDTCSQMTVAGAQLLAQRLSYPRKRVSSPPRLLGSAARVV